MPPTEADPKPLSLTAVASYLSVTDQTVHRWVEEGRFPPAVRRKDGRYDIDPGQLVAWLRSRYVGRPGPPDPPRPALDAGGRVTNPLATSRDIQRLLRITSTQLRWIVDSGQAGAYDLTGERKADASAGGLPRAQTLYGDLPSQFRDPDSFASRLAGMLEVRRKYGLDKAERLDVLETDGKGTVALAHRLPGGEVEITALNFSREETEESLPVGEYKASAAADLLGREPETKVEDGMLPLKLGPLEGRVLLLRRELSGDSKKEGGS